MGPGLLLLAWLHPHPGPWLAAGVVVGFLTDLFDGILARRLGVATPGLRRLDSQTDLVFWLCMAGCVFVARWDIGVANLGYVAAILALEVTTYVVSIAKFGRETCTHAYSAKVWSVLAVGVFVAVLGFGEGTYSFPLLFATYVLSWADVILIVIILPHWRNDVPSCYHAWLIRRGVPFRTWSFFHSDPGDVRGSGPG
jgi:CDP-diacylglycerol--glycerol-3-phosphate 3-phosphatidyltransferase